MRLRAIWTILAVAALLICGSAKAQVVRGYKSITNQAVVTMVRLGMPDDAIIAAINVGPVNFDTSSNALIGLGSQGVSERVLQSMIVAERKASAAGSGGGGQRGVMLAPQRAVALAASQGNGPGGIPTPGGNQGPNTSRMLAPQRTVALAGSPSNNAGGNVSSGNLGVASRLGRNGLVVRATACTVTQLRLRIATGNDDLRGGQNNLNIIVYFTSRKAQFASNVNKSHNWPNNSVNMVDIVLNQPVPPSEIRSLRFVHIPDGSFSINLAGLATPGAPLDIAQGIQSPDNWNMADVQVAAIGNGVGARIAGYGFHRFTGSNPDLVIPVNVPANICGSGR